MTDGGRGRENTRHETREGRAEEWRGAPRQERGKLSRNKERSAWKSLEGELSREKWGENSHGG